MRHGITLSSTNIKDLLSPIVYIFLNGKEILYIGSSQFGLSRPLSPSHHVKQAQLECTDLRIVFCSNEQEMLGLEMSLIRHSSPKYNKNHNMGKSRKTGQRLHLLPPKARIYPKVEEEPRLLAGLPFKRKIKVEWDILEEIITQLANE